MRTTVVTESGSRYVVEERDDGTFWLSGENVPNSGSVAIHDGEWEILQPAPWPPVPGQRLLLVAKHEDTARRLPGGGKHTSLVKQVIEDDDPRLERAA